MESRIHISLEVSNLEKAVDFYSKLFQADPTKVKPDYANFRLDEPRLHLALVHKPGRVPEPGPESGSSKHFGVELFSDKKLATWLSKAKDQGIEPRIEEGVTCCYATADKFWAKDPDGHEWEFWIRHGEADVMIEKKENASASACCAPKCCQ